MTLDINEQETELLLEVLKSAHSLLLDELLHTESYEYRQLLKQRDELLKKLTSKIEGLAFDSRTI